MADDSDTGHEEASAWYRQAAFSSLRHRDYRFLWAGTVFMGAGQWVQQVTLGWLLYDMTSSSVLLGALNGLRSLPFLVFGPIAGVVADRMDRRNLLVQTQALLFITALIMGIIVTAQLVEVWHLFLFTFITGTTWAFNQPIRQALVPSVVSREDLMNAVALNSMGINITKVSAPILGGLLIGWFGAGGNFFVQGAMYASVLILVYMIHLNPMPIREEQTSAFADLKEGVNYVCSNKLILALMIVSLVSQIFAMPYLTLMPIFQKDVFGTGPEGLGMLIAAPGVGGIIATFLLASIAHTFHRKGMLLLVGLILLGGCLIWFSQTDSLLLAMPALVGVGASQMLITTTSMTMMQVLVPDALHGRVVSIILLDRGLIPAGAFLAGVATSFVGAPTTVATMGSSVLVLALLVGWRVPRIRRIEM